MKVSEWSYQVLEGPLEPVYVYEAPVRFWHWTQAAVFVLLVVTGFLIGWPLPANYGDTWNTYVMGYVLTIHFVCGMTFTLLFLYRCYWACVGNKYSRMIFLPPVWNWLWWKGMWATILHYLFLNKHPPHFIGHNPLAQIAMSLIYVVGTFFICLTGIGLYAEQWGWGTGWMAAFGWITELWGGAQPLRTTHHLLMYYLCLFLMAHFYMSFREDVMGEDTQLSSITNGIRFWKMPIPELREQAANTVEALEEKAVAAGKAAVATAKNTEELLREKMAGEIARTGEVLGDLQKQQTTTRLETAEASAALGAADNHDAGRPDSVKYESTPKA